MSGALHHNGGPKGPVPTMARARARNDAIICVKLADGQIKINTPLYFNAECSNEPAWGPENQRANNFISANILYAFLQSEETPPAIRAHLITLTGRIQDPEEPERQGATRAYLLEISRAFSEDFINTLPVGEGIIPADQVHAWLSRSIDLTERAHERHLFNEHDDLYVIDDHLEVSALPFNDHGFVCARSAHQPTYNIAQKIWLRRKLRMDWCGPAVACESLAANVIDRFIDAQPSNTPLREQINGNVGDFYTPFADDFLHSMPRDGGQIPVSVMSRWFMRHL